MYINSGFLEPSRSVYSHLDYLLYKHSCILNVYFIQISMNAKEIIIVITIAPIQRAHMLALVMKGTCCSLMEEAVKV